MNHTDHIERAIRELRVTTTAETDKRVLDDAFAALEEAAVAAVILIAFALFLKVLAAKPVSLSQIYGALEKVSNVSIVTFAAGKQEPVQMEWLSQTLKISVFQIGEQFVLLDIANKLQETASLPGGSVQTIPIPENVLATAKKKITGTFGLVPFSDINDMPRAARWSNVSDRKVAAIVPGSKVYDLIWTTPPLNVEFHKWRYFVDGRTKLPKRVEVYLKEGFESDYTLCTYEVVTYPTEAEIKTLVRNIFGPDEDRLGEPEYMGTPEPSRAGTPRKK